jgi:hypothetical protein
MSFNNTLEPDQLRYVKYRRYPGIPGNWKITLNFSPTQPVISPGISIQYHMIYPQLRMDKSTLKIVVPAIPIIPGILYILLILHQFMFRTFR